LHARGPKLVRRVRTAGLNQITSLSEKSVNIVPANFSRIGGRELSVSKSFWRIDWNNSMAKDILVVERKFYPTQNYNKVTGVMSLPRGESIGVSFQLQTMRADTRFQIEILAVVDCLWPSRSI
jgi:hypothetical protein